MLTENPSNAQDNNVIDIDLSSIRKQRFRIDGDNNRILELNVSDMGIITRLNNFYPKMQKLGDKLAVALADQSETADEKELAKISEAISSLDKEIRSMLDALFEAPVSEVCLPFGTAADPHNGEFAFETVMSRLGKLYEVNFDKEFSRIKKNTSKHTAKYTKSRKK